MKQNVNLHIFFIENVYLKLHALISISLDKFA
jgi:hypothetical protein